MGNDSHVVLTSEIRDLLILEAREQTLSSVPQHTPCDLAGTELRFPRSMGDNPLVWFTMT